MNDKPAELTLEQQTYRVMREALGRVCLATDSGFIRSHELDIIRRAEDVMGVADEDGDKPNCVAMRITGSIVVLVTMVKIDFAMLEWVARQVKGREIMTGETNLTTRFTIDDGKSLPESVIIPIFLPQ